MLKLLKLLGLDVKAEIAGVRAEITRRIEEAADRARQFALGAAIIAALATFAGLFFVAALAVGLIAFYRFAEAAYGTEGALGILAAVLIVAMLILLGVALMVARSLKEKRHSEVPAYAAGESTRAAPPPQPLPQPPPEAVAASAMPSADLLASGDLREPLTLVLGLLAKDRKLGHPALDAFVAGLPSGDNPEEAVAQAVGVIRNGDRTQLAIILGAAVAAGWLLARARPHAASAPQ
ncbi:MAG: hypothetical protein JO228_08005 [Xanthobacteraceae bacterium]|nr:hypothetical protein [Xanthobacteraceae bacterium]